VLKKGYKVLLNLLEVGSSGIACPLHDRRIHQINRREGRRRLLRGHEAIRSRSYAVPDLKVKSVVAHDGSSRHRVVPSTLVLHRAIFSVNHGSATKLVGMGRELLIVGSDGCCHAPHVV